MENPKLLFVLSLSLLFVSGCVSSDSSAPLQARGPSGTLTPAERVWLRKYEQRAQVIRRREAKEEVWRRLNDAKATRIRLDLPPVSLGAVSRVASWNCVAEVLRMAFAPNGASLALGEEPNNLGGGVELREARNWRSLVSLHGSISFAWSPNSRLLAGVGEGVNIWDVASHQVRRNLNDGSGLFPTRSGKRPGVFGPLLFSDDGRRLATMGEDPHSMWKPDNGPQTEAAFARGIALKEWDVQSGRRLLVKLGGSSGWVTSLVPLSRNPHSIEFATWTKQAIGFSKSRPRIYAYGYHSTQDRLFGALVHPDEPSVIIGIPSDPGRVAVSDNGWLYAWANTNGYTVNICRSRDEKTLKSLILPEQITAVALSPDAHLLAVACANKVEVYDLGTSSPQKGVEENTISPAKQKRVSAKGVAG